VDVVRREEYFFRTETITLIGEIMKTVTGKLILFALGMMTIGVSAGHAQIANQLGFKASQPFTVGNTTLAAGSYTIRQAEFDSTVLEIASTSGRPAVLVDTVSTQPESPQGPSHLVFNKYKNVLALSQIFPGNGNTGYTLVQGHPEQLAAKTETPTKQTVPTSGK
jgi:hypothetical protein